MPTTRPGTYNSTQRSKSMNNIYVTPRSTSPTENKYNRSQQESVYNSTYESVYGGGKSIYSLESNDSQRSSSPRKFSKSPRINRNKSTSPDNPKLRYSRHNTSPQDKTKTPPGNKRSNIQNRKTTSKSLSVTDVPTRSPSPSKAQNKPKTSNLNAALGASGSSEQTQTKEIILRKISLDKRWYEEREETLYVHKRGGSVSKKSKKQVADLEIIDDEELMESLANYDKKGNDNLDLERSSQLYSRHGRSLIQDNQHAFSIEVLTQINIFRVEHLVKLLKLNENLNYYAREWGKYLAHVGQSSFTNRHDIGESIFVKIGSQPFAKISGDDVVEKWYAEIKNHNYQNPTDVTAPNFTQMIWKSTREIGVAIERSLDGKISYVVVFYYPKGSFPNDQDRQVPPIGGFASKERNEKGYIKPHLAEKDENFLAGVIRAINFYRIHHSAIPLQLDGALTEYSQEWADQLAKEDRIRSRPRNVFGENIYCSSIPTDQDIPGQEPVEYWYKKKQFYNYSEPGDIRAAPFTQLIWHDSRDIGVGIAKSESNIVYVVANFNPPGNLVGSFEKQVLQMRWK